MIASSRSDQAQYEECFADGLTSWMRGDDGPSSVAASRIMAETLLLWRVILNSKIQR